MTDLSVELFAGAAMSEKTESGRLRFISMREMLKPRPPIEWTVEGILSPGSLSVFVGKPGCGKTYLLLWLAACVSVGVPFLGRKTTRHKVLIVDEESGEDRLARRFGMITAGIGQSCDDLDSLCLNQFDLRDSTDVSLLETAIVNNGYKLVIIDALADVMPGGDENTVKDVQPLMINLRKLAAENKTSICIIHHSNKTTGEYRGSSAIQGACDSMFTVVKDESILKIDSTKVRDGEPFNLAARMGFEDGLFWLSETETTKEKRLITIAESKVLQFVRDNQPVDTSKIYGMGCNRTTLYRLRDDGYFVRTNPSSNPRILAIYKLTAKGEELEANI